ncbi:MAG: glutamate formimidoyltransferase [Acidobacteria bacterium]|nr:glutamate formimidoyltransferase [Acidobacteriota bacterium]
MESNGNLMHRWLECVPNVSEGRDEVVLRSLRAAIETTPGIGLLDSSADADHHRSVFTFAGAPDAVADAVLALAHVAVKAIDLRRHKGVHPRIGALDVVPFVPLDPSMIPECIDLASRVAQRLWNELNVPVYLYGEAARRPERRRLEHVRRGQFEGLGAALPGDVERRPDIGGPTLHETAGAVAVGVRKFLIAFNVNLATPDLALGKEVARRVRESSGGLPGVKALGLPLGSRGLTQVSMNLTDFQQTSPRTAFEAVSAEAASLGVSVLESELIGLVPAGALGPNDPERLRIRSFDQSMIFENRLRDVMGG